MPDELSLAAPLSGTSQCCPAPTAARTVVLPVWSVLTVGATPSTMIDVGAEGSPTLPTASVARERMLWVPSLFGAVQLNCQLCAAPAAEIGVSKRAACHAPLSMLTST